MRIVDFYGLSRAAQDHFVDAASGTEPPSPVLVKLGGPTAHRVGWAISAASLVGLVFLALRGFGELESDAVVHSIVLIAVFVALAIAFVYGILHALAGERNTRVSPWKAGIYAFAGVTVDARTHSMRVLDTDDLQQVEDAAGGLVLVYATERFAFAAGPDDVAKAKAAIAEAKNAGPASDPKVQAGRDPLAEPRMSSPLAPTQSRQRSVPAWAKLRYLIAPAIGVAIGAGLFFGRNVASDDRAFEAARSKNDVSSYRAYLKHGVRHKDEVAKTLLPRAELKDAEKAGTVDAILAFQRAHQGTAISAEVDSALRKSLLAELDVAKKEGTLAAIAAFEAKRPQHGLDAEVKAAVHQVYTSAFEKFKTVANDKDPALLAFVQRLLSYAENKRDPKVEVRVRAVPSTSLGRADKYVTKHPLFNGETSYPTKYYEPAKLAPIAAAFAKDVAEKLSVAFPAEILVFSAGAPVDGDLPAAITVPTLFVSHNEEWTGTAYPSNRPRGIYIGVNYHFQSSFRIPADKQPLEGKALIPRSVPLKVVNDFAKVVPAPGDVETAVYTSMSKEGFDVFETRFLGQIFRPKPKQ
ncbi:MAG: hypothetical protein ACXVEF_41605 [Polyangiales bacterium]